MSLFQFFVIFLKKGSLIFDSKGIHAQISGYNIEISLCLSDSVTAF